MTYSCAKGHELNRNGNQKITTCNCGSLAYALPKSEEKDKKEEKD